MCPIQALLPVPVPSRAVVDPNVLVSAFLKPGSLPDEVLQAVRRELLQPVVCAEIMAEYRDVAGRARLRLPQAEVFEVLSLIGRQAQWVHVRPYAGSQPLPDPADWPFIACALAVQCPVITGNARHFPGMAGLRVMTAREWLDARGTAGTKA